MEKETTKSNALLDLLDPSPITSLMFNTLKRLTGLQRLTGDLKEELRAAYILEKKIRLEFMRPPHKCLFLNEEMIVWAIENIFERATPEQKGKMTNFTYISRNFKRILAPKKE